MNITPPIIVSQCPGRNPLSNGHHPSAENSVIQNQALESLQESARVAVTSTTYCAAQKTEIHFHRSEVQDQGVNMVDFF